MRQWERWVPRLAMLAALSCLPGTAAAWDYTPAAISGLTSIYGYLSNQEAVLERAAVKYPALRNDIQRARVEFDRQYPNALGAVSRLFQEIPLPATDRARLATKVMEMDRESMQSALASEQAVQSFLQRVRESARGDMEKASLQLLLAAVYDDKPAAEMASPMAVVYRTSGARQVGGADVTLRMPLSWDRDPVREKLQPDATVFAFTSQGGNGLATIDLLGKPLPQQAASAAEAARSADDLRALIGTPAKIVAQGVTKLANRRATWASFTVTGDGGRALQHGRVWWLPLRENGYSVVLLCRTPTLSPEAAEAERKRLEPLWMAVAASITAPPAR